MKMNKIVKLHVIGDEDYWKVYKLVEIYTNGGSEMCIIKPKEEFQFKFPVSVFKYKKCIHDIELAKELGVNVEIIAEA